MDRDDSGTPRPDRRGVLAGTAATLAAGLAGCAVLRDDDGLDAEDPPGTPTFKRLEDTTLYVAEGVDLTVTARVETTAEPTDAELLVLPDDTDVRAQRAAEWLTADRVLALYGLEAEPTWLDWAQSDAFDGAFDNRGHGDAEPDPQLLVGAAVGDHVTTFRRTWGDGPRDRDVLVALDGVLVDLAEMTPRE